MTQAADYAIDVQLSVGPKHDFEQDFSLQPELAGFVGINRIRFESDFDLIRRRTGVRRLNFRSAVRKFLLAKAARCDTSAAAIAAAIAVASDGDSVAKSCARDRALQSFCAASAVSCPTSGARSRSG